MNRTTANPAGRGWALAGLSTAMLAPALATSIANVGLPTLSEAFGASFQAVQWVVLAYLLAITALIVSVGRLGDIVGRRRLLLLGAGLFTIASMLCSLAPALGLLIAARAAQGLGAAVMMALAMAMVGETVGKARTGAAMGLMGTMSAVGTALGPSLGGALIGSFGWRSVFFVNVPLGLMCLVLASRTLAADPKGGGATVRFDLFGAALLALSLTCYALAMTLGRGRFGLASLMLLSTALIGTAVFVHAQRRSPAPLLDTALFRDPALSACLATNALVSTVMMATLVVGPFYLSGRMGLTVTQIGLVMSSGPLVAALAGVPAGRMVDLFGPRGLILAGLVGMSGGLIALATAPEAFGSVGYVAALIVVTGAYALFQAANSTAVMGNVPADRRGVVSAMLSLSRNLGLITGASAMGAVFVIASGAADVTAASPEAVATGMRTTFLVAAGLVVAALALTIGMGGRARQPTSARALRGG